MQTNDVDFVTPGKPALSTRSVPLSSESALLARHFAAVSEDDHDAVVEGLIGLLWDCARPSHNPLWWCLGRDIKQAFRDRIREALDA